MTMQKVNLITTCGGAYDMVYANKMHNMFSRHYDHKFDSYCITERPSELSNEITPLEPEYEVKGWWNKLLALGPQMPSGWVIVIDVDLVILNNITEVIEYAIEQKSPLAAYSDAIHWCGAKLSTSFFMFESGTLVDVYNKFVESYPGIIDFPAGDQGWLNTQVSEILYLDEVFPNFKRSLKFDVATKGPDGSLHVPSSMGDTILLDCHGRPKPHEMLNWPVVANNWI